MSFQGLIHPFSAVISGPSQSGKTYFLRIILKAPCLWIGEAPERVLWCYGIRNDAQLDAVERESSLPIEFVEGLPNVNDLSGGKRTLIVLDDLMTDAGKSAQVADFFTKGCHHKNASVFLVLQNIYHQAPQMRNIHTNTNYLILFKNPRDYSQITSLNRQLFPQWKGYLLDAYKTACSQPHGYLIIDLHQRTNEDRRVYSGIFPHQKFVYHLPPDSKFCED